MAESKSSDVIVVFRFIAEMNGADTLLNHEVIFDDWKFIHRFWKPESDPPYKTKTISPSEVIELQNQHPRRLLEIHPTVEFANRFGTNFKIDSETHKNDVRFDVIGWTLEKIKTDYSFGSDFDDMPTHVYEYWLLSRDHEWVLIKSGYHAGADVHLGDSLRCLSPDEAAKWCVELDVPLPEQLVELDPIAPFEFVVKDSQQNGEGEDPLLPDVSVENEEKYRCFRLPMDDPEFKLPPQYDDRTVFAVDRWLFQNKSQVTWPELILELERVAMKNKWGDVPKTETRLRSRLQSYCDAVGLPYVPGQRGNPNNIAKSKEKKGRLVNPKPKPQG